MRRNLLIVLLILVLIIAAGVLLYRPKPPALAPQGFAPAPESQGAVTIIKGSSADNQLTAAQGGWRDPFNIPGKSSLNRPAVSPASQPAVPMTAPAERQPQLQGTFDGAEGRRAFIDDETYSVGDTVSGYKIVGIEDTKVTLTKDGKTLVLWVE